MDLASWRAIVDVSLAGTFLVCRPPPPASGSPATGRSSRSRLATARRATGTGAHYAAAKAGVDGFVKSLALELAPAGVTVNAVAPGPVDTPMLGHIADCDRWQRQVESMIPIRRIGTTADILGPVMFLLRPESDFMTGQVLHVNGADAVAHSP